MTRTLAAVSAALALGLAGCQTLRSEHALIGAARPPTQQPVKVVMEGAPVPADAEEIAIVSATGVPGLVQLPDVIRALQAEAAALGANAIVRVRYDVGASTATATGVAVWIR